MLVQLNWLAREPVGEPVGERVIVFVRRVMSFAGGEMLSLRIVSQSKVRNSLKENYS
jgi:hypothetical protein